jgi:predicted AAA+ superfamily ATPase
MIIARARLAEQVTTALSRFPVVLLLGPRQCGKSTMAREIVRGLGGTFFDLEDPETPLQPPTAKLVLKDLRGLVVIDEFQRQPELFPLLRVLADRNPLPARFLVLGSAAPDLVRGVSESLAGRVAYVDMGGFTIDEITADDHNLLWMRGGFPRSFLGESDIISYEWRMNFVQTFLERDIPQLGIRIPAATLRRFWIMLAHYHGNVWNAAEFARSMGTKEDTARRYLDILTGAYFIRQLHPWHENVGKRLIKAPKIYVRDTGILHALLGLRDPSQVLSHPKLGFSWEGFAVEQIVRTLHGERDVYFYGTHGGAELDCFIVRNGRRFGFECKYEDAPRTTKSMHVVVQDLALNRLFVVYPGERSYPLTEKIEVIPLKDVESRWAEME